MIILICVAVLSFLAMMLMVGTRVTAVRSGKVAVMEQPAFHTVIQTKIDFVAVLFVLLCREVSKFVSLYILVFLHRGVSAFKMLTIRVEKKFSRIIDAVKGRGDTSQKGAVSFFLREIEDHKDRVKVKISL